MKKRWYGWAGVCVWLLVGVMTACAAGGNECGAMKQKASVQDGSGGKAWVNRLELIITQKYPLKVSAVISGSLPDGCTAVQRIEEHREGRTIALTLVTERPRGAVCTQALTPFQKNHPIDTRDLEAGNYTVTIQNLSAAFGMKLGNTD